MLGELKLMPPRTAVKVNCLVMKYLHFESVRGDLQEGYFALPDANFLSSWCQFPFSRAQNRGFCAFLAFGTPVFEHFEHKMVLRQISCCQVKQVWKILIQRSRSEARPYILLLIHFILLFRPSISPLLIEYFMAFLMGEMSRWTLFTKLTTSP